MFLSSLLTAVLLGITLSPAIAVSRPFMPVVNKQAATEAPPVSLMGTTCETEITPAGTWTRLHFFTEDDGLLYYRFQDNNDHIFTLNNINWMNITPPGIWPYIIYEAINGEETYINFRDEAQDGYLYVTENGSPPRNVTPPGMTAGIRSYVTQKDRRVYFHFYDEANQVHLYAFGCTHVYLPAITKN